MDRRSWNELLEATRASDIVSYLDRLGYQPARAQKNGWEFWYHSPLREEATPSFKVNRKLNRWFDFGLHQGGNLVDFGLRYFQCSLPEFLARFDAGFTGHPLPIGQHEPWVGRAETESKIRVLTARELYAWPLKSYLQERRIPMTLAAQYCCQLDYELNGRRLYGIGFKNDAGGYEIRSSLFKHSSSPKAVTTFDNGSASVQVFEGFMDFLSYRLLPYLGGDRQADFVVLNGAGMLETARPFLERHERIALWLDRDNTGRAYTQYALGLDQRYVDESSRFDGYKDLNDFLTKKEMAVKKKLGLRFG